MDSLSLLPGGNYESPLEAVLGRAGDVASSLRVHVGVAVRCHHHWKPRIKGSDPHVHWCMIEVGGHEPPCVCHRCDAQDWCTAHPTLETGQLTEHGDPILVQLHLTVRPSRVAKDIRMQAD